MVRRYVVLLLAIAVGCGSPPSTDSKVDKEKKRPKKRKVETAAAEPPKAEEPPPPSAPPIATIDDAVAVLATESEVARIREASELLVRNGGAAVAPLATLLANTTSTLEARVAACRVLGQIGEPAIPALLRVADPKAGNPVHVRRKAVEQLGLTTPAQPNTIAALIILLDDVDIPTQRAAVVAIGKIGPAAAKAKPKIMEIIRTTDDRSLRAIADNTIKQIDPRKILPH
jgi:HEAT repeat protein